MVLSLIFYSFVSGALEVGPCSAEKSAYESNNDSIADSVAQQIELRTQLNSVKNRRQEILTPTLKETEGQLDTANRAVLQESCILNVILEHRPLLESLHANAEKFSSFSARLTAHMINDGEISLSNALRVAGDAEQPRMEPALFPDIQKLTRLVRTLEGSRTWSEQMTDFRQEIPQGAQALHTALQKINMTQEVLGALLTSGALTALKQKVAEAQGRIDSSINEQRGFEDKAAVINKRLEGMRLLLPAQNAALHKCMHRVQFGDTEGTGSK